MGDPKRILFVDDEAPLLNLLALACRRGNPDWEVVTAACGAQALELLQERTFDLVVSDMRMPGMNGAELLHEVMKRQPQTVRVILSGYADQQSVLRCLGAAHQYLTKPFDLQALRSTIQRLLALNRLVAQDHFRVLTARIHSLPSLPALYFKLMEELASPEATTDSVGDLIAQDVALTAKLLQLVNSAFFGVARQVTSAHEAVQILGFGTVRTLALSIYVFSRFDPDRMPGFPMERLWKHSMATGLLARKIATTQGCEPAQVEAAFTAGSLHDIGKLVLALGLPSLYSSALEQAQKQGVPQCEAETRVLGAAHAEVGAYLLGLWGLPVDLVDAVAWHHRPGALEPQTFRAASAVHLADQITARECPCHEGVALAPLDQAHVRALDLPLEPSGWLQSDATS